MYFRENVTRVKSGHFCPSGVVFARGQQAPITEDLQKEPRLCFRHMKKQREEEANNKFCNSCVRMCVLCVVSSLSQTHSLSRSRARSIALLLFQCVSLKSFSPRDRCGCVCLPIVQTLDIRGLQTDCTARTTHQLDKRLTDRRRQRTQFATAFPC